MDCDDNVMWKPLYLQSQNNGFGSGERGKSSSRDRKGEVPEWSIGPHSKCGERVTVPRVRISVFPLTKNTRQDGLISILPFFMFFVVVRA